MVNAIGGVSTIRGSVYEWPHDGLWPTVGTDFLAAHVWLYD